MAGDAKGVRRSKGAPPLNSKEMLRTHAECGEMAKLFVLDLINDLPEDLCTKVDIHIRNCAFCFVRRVALQIASECAVTPL
jgi:hypothetical protein